MPKDIQRGRYIITGHNREGTDRILHFTRPQVADGIPMTTPGAVGQIYTDDAGLLDDGTVVEIAVVYDVVPK